MVEKREKHFLVVEDDPDDAFLLQRAFSGIPFCSAYICRNLTEAQCYVAGVGMYADRRKFPQPDALLTEVMIEGQEAFDFIRRVSNEQAIPVFVLTGGAPPAQKEKVLRAGAKDVIEKPTGNEALKELLFSIAGKLCATGVGQGDRPEGRTPNRVNEGS